MKDTEQRPDTDPSSGSQGGGTSAAAGALRRSPDLYRLLVEQVEDYAIFMLDPGGHVLTWNLGAERLKGYRAEEVLGLHFSIFYTEDDRRSGHPGWELSIVEEEGRYSEEGWRLRKGGEPFWASVSITALHDDEGALVGFAKVTRDLTEQKRNREELRRSEERFRLLVQSVSDYGIFMLDPNGCIASWNEGAARTYGYTEEQVLGLHFSEFYPEEDVAAGKPEMELRVTLEEGRFEDEDWRVTRDGRRFWANVVITALRDDDRGVFGFAKVTRDLTERVQATQRALADARALAELEALNQAKSDFLTGMSHELRTPLNSIAGYTDLLDQGVFGPVTESQRKSLDRIRASQQHLLALINDLLNFGAVESGGIEFDSVPVPLREVLRAVADITAPLALARDIEIRWPDAPASLTAVGDRVRMEQILLNMVTNAIKYSDPGSCVEIRQEAAGGRVVLRVIDRGMGIAPEYLDTIFEPFTRVGRARTGEREGSGLGLAISRQLALAMGGDLSVQSTLGEGSTFTLELPEAPAPS